MATEFEGEPRGAGVRVAIAISRFNQELTLRLLEGALMAMQDHQVEDGNLSVAWVPGAFELPLMASTLAKSGNYDAIVCLGVVVKGETAHFDHISTQVAAGIEAVSRETGIPVSFGVQTTFTIQQAMDRSGGVLGNRGYDATVAALAMVDVLKQARRETEPA
ncbi:MAG: 6,7-dimethyl-8-ribityllumazine synthase [Chloroflexota bacterium]|nr:6,7-dimethyl-8-ribityllumazine synthase [Chloroflexota bacterium]MEE2655972.1 6,7-dimethyl-8-ribityllumazine synthase [Chloroflexota bacterium]